MLWLWEVRLVMVLFGYVYWDDNIMEGRKSERVLNYNSCNILWHCTQVLGKSVIHQPEI